MRKYSITIWGLWVLLFLSACVNNTEVNLKDQLPENIIKTQENYETRSVAVYMDCTPSMDGFLDEDSQNFGFNNRYQNCLKQLDVWLAGRIDAQFISNYRVDTAIWKVDEDVLDKAQKKIYYQNTEEYYTNMTGIMNVRGELPSYENPCLSWAIQDSAGSDLFLLVTDMYENLANADKLVASLKAMVNENKKDGKVFGIIGVRSRYAGIIRDFGVNGVKVEYGMDEPGDRQFFVIVRGYPLIVQKLCEDLKKSIGAGEQDYQYQIFFEEDLQGLDYRNFDTCKTLENKHFWQSNLSVSINDDGKLPLYLCENEMPYVTFSYNVPDEAAESFQQLIKRKGEEVSVDLGFCGMMDLYEIDCEVLYEEEMRWEKAAQIFGPLSEDKRCFDISGVYIDVAAKKMYIKMNLFKDRMPAEILKLRWQCCIENEETDAKSQWNDWSCPLEGGDSGKTQYLNDYIAAFQNSDEEEVNTCFLDGTVYIDGR